MDYALHTAHRLVTALTAQLIVHLNGTAVHCETRALEKGSCTAAFELGGLHADARARSHTCARAHAQSLARAQSHSCVRAHITRARTHTQTRARAHIACARAHTLKTYKIT